MKYQGSCHCGRVAFEVEGELQGALSCNCSICRRKGALLWFVPRERLSLRTPEEHLATSDRGIAMQRRMLERDIRKVMEGGDPTGVHFEEGAVVHVPSGNFYRH